MFVVEAAEMHLKIVRYQGLEQDVGMYVEDYSCYDKDTHSLVALAHYEQ